MAAKDGQVTASRDAPVNPAVLVKAASLRKLSAGNERHVQAEKLPGGGLNRSQSPSVKRLSRTGFPSSPSSSSRRPSTAASIHSRIHQALRRSESEFVFSSKESTVDGFLYSSRFQQATPTLRWASSQPGSKAKVKHHAHVHSATPSTPSKSPPRSLSTAQRPSTAHNTTTLLAAESPGSSRTPAKRRSLSSANLLNRHKPEGLPLSVKTKPTDASGQPAPTLTPSTAAANARSDEAAYMQRKRKCARTFEEMIYARIPHATPSHNNTTTPVDLGSDKDARVERDGDEDPSGIEKLLANGIIQSIVALSTLSDQATQVHCCRALYYLSRIRAARKPMVTHGVVAAIKTLSRSATMEARQDLAAALCHLCEEVGLVEAMLFEGLDRCLVRLFTTTHPETKRICALAVFNISSDAVKIKHFVETYSQLLITSTKSSYGNTAASSYLMKAVYNVARLPMFHVSLLGENIPRFLASQLPHVADDIKILALQALISLCDVKTNRLQILSQGFCNLLEKMLTIASADVQERALLVLLLLSIDEGSRIKLCNWVPAATIISSASSRLSDPSASTLIYLDSCIFRNLCDSVLTHHEMLEEGAVPLLLQLSRHTDHAIKSNAVCALVSIIASSPEESAEYVVEILDELITLAQSPVHHVCLFAVGAIYNIACNDDCLPLLMQSLDLIDCLRELAKTVSHDNVAELTAATIYRLATMYVGDEEDASKSAPVLLMQRGFLPVLVQLIRQFRGARAYAVNTLYMLVQSDHSTTLFPHGSDEVSQLVSALSDDGAARKPNVAASTVELDAARSAVTLLAYLANQRVNHCLLVRNGAVFRYLKSLRRVMNGDCHDETIVLNSAFVFYALTVSQEGCEQLIREQGIEEFTHLARTAKLHDSVHMHQIKELFMMTMCRISSFIGLEVRLIEHGAIDAVLVLALVSSTDSTSIKGLCIKTLANCLVSKNCARPLIEHGVIWALSSLAVVNSPETRYACAVSLCNLATVPFMLARFLDAGAPRALIHILQKSEGDNATALVVIKAIANLVANEKICMVFVNEDIERHLSVFFASATSSDEMRQLAAMVLLRVTSANDAVISPEHLKHGVFVWMEQIIVMEDDGLVKNCMLTVHDLTCSTTIDIAELDVDYILRIIIQVFQRHARSADVLTLCLWVLYNLSCQFIVLHELVRPEILEFLRQRVPTVALPFPLPHSSSSSSRLMASASTLALLDGVLAQTDPTVTQSLDVKLCCLILHNLSCARESPQATTSTTASSQTVLASLVNARGVGILSDVYLQRDDLKETCAIAVCNLAIGRVNSTRIVQDRAGELVIHFVFSSLFHRCHYHIVSVAIRKMVNAPGNQNMLLHRGIGRAIVHVLELTMNGGVADIETTRNLMASLCVVSKGKAYLPQLLQDGALPIVIAVSESRTGSGPGNGSSNAVSSEILSYCFEILSELCSINFEAFAKKKIIKQGEASEGDEGDEINVINTLTRLSELHHLTHHSGGGASGSPGPLTYYERGDDGGKMLAYAHLLTFMKKSPASTNAVKKNLELQATFQVPARKWLPDVHPKPRDPPPLECAEIPLTEGSQSIPHEIREKIKELPALGKEPLVRDESSNNIENGSGAATPQHQSGAGTLETPDDLNEVADLTPMSKIMMLGARHAGGGKKLQRSLAGRNLSLTGSTSLLG